MTKPDGERISYMEARLADMQNDVTEVKTDIKEIKLMLTEKFIPRDEVKRLVDDLHRDIKNSKTRRWIENTFSAAAGAVLIFVIQRALTTL